jgi:hypothetical protein
MAPDLSHSFDELFAADTILAAREVVASHPELLEDQAIQILGMAADDAPERVRPRMRSLLDALMEWRSLGLDAVVDELAAFPERQDLTDDLAELVCAQDTVELREVVRTHPDLLGDEAERRILEMEADSSAYTADRLFVLLTFLRAWREGDLDAACAAYDHDAAEVEAASRLASEYAFMSDEAAQAAFLREHPVVLGRQGEQAIAGTFEALGQDPDIAATLGLQAKLDTVRRLREELRAPR